jgi:hypothetical protein
MSAGNYSKAYFLVLLRSVDILAATWIWRDYDITISSMCGLELRKRSLGEPAKAWMCFLGECLNKLQANHCYLAIAADYARTSQAQAILTVTAK